MSVRVTIPRSKAKPYDANGVLQPSWVELVNLMLREKIQLRGDEAEITGLIDTQDVILADVKRWLDSGAKVYNYPTFVVLTAAQGQTNVPAYLPGSTPPVKWVDWSSADPVEWLNQTPRKWFVELIHGGNILEASIAQQLVDGGFVVRTLSQVLKLLES